MKNKPIGFFDSGLGGLTCVAHMLKKMSNEKVIYYGDTSRTPYGSKDPKTIITFATEIVEFLTKKDVKMVVIACNSVSAIALDHLRAKFSNIPIIGIISPVCRLVSKVCNDSNNIGIIGTKATIKSHSYLNKINSYKEGLNIFELATPAFVPLIEEGIYDNEIMDLTIKHYLDGFIKPNKIDTLILGCTHYPFLEKSIRKFYPNLNIIDPSKEIVDTIEYTLNRLELVSPSLGHRHEFYASDLSENFTLMLNNIFKTEHFTAEFALP